ncbi:MAG: hypothetical protein ACREXR_23230, partial [Gammaproteobacteria bacterium]
MKAMLSQWDRQFPGRLESLFSALQQYPDRTCWIRPCLISPGFYGCKDLKVQPSIPGRAGRAGNPLEVQ